MSARNDHAAAHTPKIAKPNVAPSAGVKFQGDRERPEYSSGVTMRKDVHGSAVLAVTAPDVGSTVTHCATSVPGEESHRARADSP